MSVFKTSALAVAAVLLAGSTYAAPAQATKATTKTAAARLVLRVIATSNPGVSEEHRVGFGTCEVLADPAPLCAYYIAIAL